ncbi:hypothetical protein [Parasutterella muris]|jgi:hypothetical protein|uniref:Uncharacterized protein n=1 Tax=Parasutterella muris TaxID=2565572 RepID=A0A6L6YFS9_9BURK|nr:hypothetical protein [Parasutterella muris]MVX55679.1 hypothetical protein [Parasutterella muris]
MPKCSLNCNRGCGHDHSSKAEQPPSIVDIEVVRRILSQALVNMFKRSIACVQGEITEDERAEKDQKLVEWLGDTFCGKNPHFEIGPDDWNPDGLAQFIRMTVQEIAEKTEEDTPEETIYETAAYFCAKSYLVLRDTFQAGWEIEDANNLPPMLQEWVETWTMLFVGAVGDDFE